LTYDLTKFDLGDMLKCSLRLREGATGAPTLDPDAALTWRTPAGSAVGPRVCQAGSRTSKLHRIGE